MSQVLFWPKETPELCDMDKLYEWLSIYDFKVAELSLLSISAIVTLTARVRPLSTRKTSTVLVILGLVLLLVLCSGVAGVFTLFGTLYDGWLDIAVFSSRTFAWLLLFLKGVQLFRSFLLQEEPELPNGARFYRKTVVLLAVSLFALSSCDFVIRFTRDYSGVLYEVVKAQCMVEPFALVVTLSLLGLHLEQSYVELAASEECPEMASNWFSRLFFFWLNPIILRGAQQPLTADQMWRLSPHDRAGSTSRRLGRHLDRARREISDRSSRWRLFIVLLKTFGLRFALGSSLKLFNDAAQFVGPLFLTMLIHFMSSTKPIWDGVLLCFAMFGAQMIGALGEAQYFQTVTRVGWQLRSAVISCLTKKLLRLSTREQQTRGAGQIVTLVSGDIEFVQRTVNNLSILWSSPLRIILSMILLYQQLGVGAFVGSAVLACLLPIQQSVVKYTGRLNSRALKITDQRVKLSSDTLSSIELVKCYAWEKRFSSKIVDLRAKELKVLKSVGFLKVFNVFMITAAPLFVALSSFWYFTCVDGEELTPSRAFTALALFAVLRRPLLMLPNVLNNIGQSWAALKRLGEFLLDAEQSPSTLEYWDKSLVEDGEAAVRIQNGTFAWSDEPQIAPVLRSVNLSIPRGALVAVVGATGTGKSSLFSALLGTMYKRGGKVGVEGSCALAEQVPYILNATVRENILMGAEYEEEKFKRAIRCTELLTDLQQLPAGDLTEIGEKGVNLSGGQKARVSLARAVYSEADVVLLDDPLAALDPHVGQNVFSECVCGAMSGLTRLLITNSFEFLGKADLVVRIDFAGADDLTNVRCMAREEAVTAEMEFVGKTAGPLYDTVSPQPPLPAKGAPPTAESATGSGKLVQLEHREVGILDRHVLSTYISALGGWKFTCCVFSLYLFSEAARVGSSWWVAIWTKNEFSWGNIRYMQIYGEIIGGQIVLVVGNQLIQMLSALRASKWLHDTLIWRLLRAPLSFFHTTPLGRIQNRLSKDLGDIDRQLVFAVTMFFMALSRLLGVFVVVGAGTLYVILLYVPAVLLFLAFWNYYQKTSRENKRLDSTTRSPIYEHIRLCLDGLPSVRAYRLEAQMENRMDRLVDGHIRFNMLGYCLNRWLSIRLEFLGGVLVVSTAVMLCVFRDSISPATAGLVLSFGLQLTELLNLCVRAGSLAENSLNAVERVVEYSETTPQEPALVLPGVDPGPDWPTGGAVEFKCLRMRYRKGLPLVLRDVSLSISPGQKVGFCGRTGAGKSSMLMALYQLVPLESGSILIDGLDISKMGLHALRSKLSIIPQVPILFQGTLRENLDPFESLDDEQLWSALEQVQLAEHVRGLPSMLRFAVAHGGENFSVGQRQLLCLTRALLRESDILVLDEATASVDAHTDLLIQETLRRAFADKTVITIAHRLNTIMDSDLIVVFDGGLAVESGAPEELLKTDSRFRAMVSSGSSQHE